jgi:hypothetical protein
MLIPCLRDSHIPPIKDYTTRKRTRKSPKPNVHILLNLEVGLRPVLNGKGGNIWFGK